MSERQCDNKNCNKEDCGSCPNRGRAVNPEAELNSYSSIRKVIGVASGKGGVGKSTVTAMLARKLNTLGLKVGIMDADITGPSIPRLFNVKGELMDDSHGRGVVPLVSEEGIRIVSMNFLLKREEDAVLLRGPLLGSIVRQFWTETFWGDLDCLLIDMPPGTGDIPLTLYQSIPMDGVVVVTTPQDMVKMIVMKACDMAEKLNIPILGLVENFSFFKCPDCGKMHRIFGEGNTDELAALLGTEVIARLPIMPDIAEMSRGRDMPETDIDIDLITEGLL